MSKNPKDEDSGVSVEGITDLSTPNLRPWTLCETPKVHMGRSFSLLQSPYFVKSASSDLHSRIFCALLPWARFCWDLLHWLLFWISRITPRWHCTLILQGKRYVICACAIETPPTPYRLLCIHLHALSSGCKSETRKGQAQNSFGLQECGKEAASCSATAVKVSMSSRKIRSTPSCWTWLWSQDKSTVPQAGLLCLV